MSFFLRNDADLEAIFKYLPTKSELMRWIKSSKFKSKLASAAGLLMGQSDEKKPIVLIKGFNKSTYEVNNAFDLIMNENEDLYR